MVCFSHRTTDSQSAGQLQPSGGFEHLGGGKPLDHDRGYDFS